MPLVVAVLFVFVLLGGAVAGLVLLLPPLTALVGIAAIGFLVVALAALTSAFRRRAEGYDRMLGA